MSPNEVAREFEQRTWTHEQGLPDDRVKAILQTRDGYLWIGTERGLARFDAAKFTVFNRFNTPELMYDDCWALTEDSDSNLWIGIREGPVRIHGNQFRRFKGDLLRPEVAGLYMCPRRSGGIWASGIQSVWRIHGNEARNFPIEPERLFRHIVALEEDEQAGMVWLGSYDGLARFDPGRETFDFDLTHTNFEQFPAVALRRGQDGRQWALLTERPSIPGTKGDKCWLACFKDGRWVRPPNLAQEDFSADSWPAFIAFDSFGAIWLPGRANGLHRFAQGRFELLAVPHKGEQDYATCACSDREGNVWIGTELSGLQRWTPRRIVTYTTRDGLANDNIWTIYEARDGSVLIGTDGGVSRFKDGRITNIRMPGDAQQNYVRSVVEDRAGTVWVGTMRTVGPIVEGEISPLKLAGQWFETKTRVLLPARDGAMWIGTVSGLKRFHSGEHVKYTKADGLGSNDVRALLEDRSGNLWVGTSEGGLSRLHAGKFTTLTITNGLPSNNVWALHEDSDGVLWLGTDNGLARLENGRVTNFTTRQGLPDNQVNCILEDDFGRLWVSYDHGIYWVHKAQLNDVASRRARTVRPVKYDESDGLLSTETNGQKSNPVGCKTRDGRLWFPTTKGVAVLDPSKVSTDEIAPLTVIEQIRAEGKPIFDIANPVNTREPDVAAYPHSTGEVWQLRPGSGRMLEFRYTANTFVAPEKTQFKYRLVGLDEHWIEAGTRREAYFTSLRPGDYRFEVIACNHHGVWQDQGAGVGFQLAPFYYQTWWFYFVTGGGGVALAAAAVAWRVRELRKIHHLEQVNALNEQRKRIARDIHDELGASLTHILQLSGGNRGGLPEPGRAEAPTDRIASIAEEAVDHIGEIVWANNPEYDTLEDLVAYLREYAANFFAASAVQVRFDFPESVPSICVTGLFRRHVLLLVKEALQNVIKHAGAKVVQVRLAIQHSHMELYIADDGCGLGGNASARSGNGLTNMRQRVTELNGTFEPESAPGKGTAIRVSLPLQRVTAL